MKIYSTKLPSEISKIKLGTIKSVLIYGPDKGLIDDCIKRIKDALKLNTFTISYDSFILKIESILNNRTIFASKDLIQIKNTPKNIETEFKDYLSKEIYHFPLFIAEELGVSSGIRKFFESKDDLLSIACYPEDQHVIYRYVQQKLHSQNKKIDSDTLKIFVENIIGNRFVVDNAIEKLLLYTDSKNTISREDVHNTCFSNRYYFTENLCASFIQNDAKTYFAEVEKILNEGISAIWIIRAIIRHCINLYIIHLNIKSGLDITQAIKKIKPPIIYKFVELFRNNILLTDIYQIEKLIKLLNSHEIEYKRYQRDDMEMCSILFFLYKTSL